MATGRVGSALPSPAAVAVTAGAGAAAATATPSPSSVPSSSVECCMCGDHGLARELFRCRSCNFRYQHKYCSDLYPKTESYRACNWCLREDAGAANSKPSAKYNHKSITSPTSRLSPSSSIKDHHHQQQHHHHHHHPQTAPSAGTATADQTNHRTKNANNSSHSHSSSTSTADNNSTGSSVAGAGAGAASVKQVQRGGDYTAHLLAKPLKKLRPAVLERSASEVIVRVRAAEEMGAPAAAAARKVAGGRHAVGGAVRGKIRRYKLLEEVSS